MKKLVKGISHFRKTVKPEQLEQFRKLAIEQKPDALFIACSDSRVVPNLFASTDPGDLFVVRNLGNIIPPDEPNGESRTGTSELAAIEFALKSLEIKDIIICGHSECGAMRTLCEADQSSVGKHLSDWIKNAWPSKVSFEKQKLKTPKGLSDLNALSQVNVLQQIEHLKSYSLVRESIASRSLALHAWWFDIATARVYGFNQDSAEFELI